MDFSKTRYLEKKIVEAIFSHQAMPAIAGYVGITTQIPGEDGNATELYDGQGNPADPFQGYDRYALNLHFPATVSIEGNLTIIRNSLAQISWTPNGDSWSPKGICVWDAPDRGAGNMLLYHVVVGDPQALDGQAFQIPQNGWTHTET